MDKEAVEGVIAIEALNKTVADLEQRLKHEGENNINLEQYTQRENPKFNNIKEVEHENCKSVVYKVIEKDLGIDTSSIRFHEVH